MKKIFVAFLTLIFAFPMISGMNRPEKAPEPVYVEEQTAYNLLDFYRSNPDILEKSLEPKRQITAIAQVVDCMIPNAERTCKIALMELIENRVRSSGFPNTYSEVCYQHNQWQGFSKSIEPSQGTLRLAEEFMETINTPHVSPIESNLLFVRMDPDGLYFREAWESTEETFVSYWG